MNCSRVRRWLPLYAGADLSVTKARRLEKHLDRCADCGTKLKELRTALDGIRAVAESETIDWPEAEWEGLMARVKFEKHEPQREAPRGAIPRKALAYGLAAVLVIGIAFLIWRNIFSPPSAPLLSEVITLTPAQPSRSIVTGRADFGSYPLDVPFSVPAEQRALDRTMLAAGTAPEKTTQDLMSITLVSQDTGLNVHWTFNRNFEWKEEKK